MSSWIGSCLVVAVVWTLVRVVPGQPADYAAIVDTYQSGQFDAAVSSLLTLYGERPTGSDLFVANVLRARPFRSRPLQLVFALETEAAMRSGWPIACAAPERLGFVAPQRNLAIFNRLDLAGRLADTGDGGKDYEFLHAWYLLLIAYDQGQGDLRTALTCLEIAPQPVKDDPAMRLALGAIHETAWQWEHEDGVDITGLQPDLDKAEKAYEAALRRAPDLDEARVRLGRVQTLAGHPDRAIATLRPVGPAAGVALSYLARLFEGDACERLGDDDGANRNYAAATALVPAAQSAWMAIARLKHARGRRADAAATVAAVASQSSDVQPLDPWYWYYRGTARRSGDYKSAMRALVTR